MIGRCVACMHSRRQAIDDLLAAGIPLGAIGQHYGLRASELSGHAAHGGCQTAHPSALPHPQTYE